jgi:hypothetical protein
LKPLFWSRPVGEPANVNAPDCRHGLMGSLAASSRMSPICSSSICLASMTSTVMGRLSASCSSREALMTIAQNGCVAVGAAAATWTDSKDCCWAWAEMAAQASAQASASGRDWSVAPAWRGRAKRWRKPYQKPLYS